MVRRITHRLFVNRVLVLITIPLLLLLTATIVRAATYTVDTMTDDSSKSACTLTPNDCSLRGAITTANTDTAADTITLPAGTYLLTITGAGEDANATGDLDIIEDLTIVGESAETTIIDGGGRAGIMDNTIHIPTDLMAKTITLKNLTVTGSNTNPGLLASVNIVSTFGTTSIEDSVIRNNTNGVTFSGDTPSRIVNILRSSIRDNSGFGIAGSGQLNIYRSGINSNGEGISIGNGTLNMANSTVSNNLGVGVDVGEFTDAHISASTLIGNDLEDLLLLIGDGFANIRGSVIGICSDAGNFNINSLGYNIVEGSSCFYTNQSTDQIGPGLDAMTGPLIGEPGYHRSLPGSAAIDIDVDCTLISGLNNPLWNDGDTNTVDQRAVPRPLMNTCDSGAFETSTAGQFSGLDEIEIGPGLLANWTAPNDPTMGWHVDIGSNLFPSNIYFDPTQRSPTDRSVVIDELPTDGRTVYVQLSFNDVNGGVADFARVRLKKQPGILTPNPIADYDNTDILDGPLQAFTWDANGKSVANWLLYAGSTERSFNYYSSGDLSGNTLSATITGLPTDGSLVHVTLWYREQSFGPYTPVDYDYTANSQPDMPSPNVQLVTTPDRIISPNYGWVLYDNGTKQWVDATCRATLQATGLGVDANEWSVIASYPDAIPRSCDEISKLVASASFPRMATTPDRESLPDYGWVLFADGTKQWIDAECRNDLSENGLETDILAWDEISDYVDGIAKDCDDIGNSNGEYNPTLEILVTPDRVELPDYGWVKFQNGTKQWIDSTCRDTLESNGVGVTILSWGEIDLNPDVVTFVDCQALLEL